MNWYKKIANMSVPMTPAESNWANWALDPMYDHWCSESGAWDRDGQMYEEIQLPRIAGSNLLLSDVPEINEDLLYRLEDQAPATSTCDANSGQQISARCRSSFNLAEKIRNILG